MTTEVGAAIREARESRGLGVNQLAKKARVRNDWISRVESGHTERPGKERLVRVAQALEMDPIVLVNLVYPDVTGEHPSGWSFSRWVWSDERLNPDQCRALVALYEEFTRHAP